MFHRITSGLLRDVPGWAAVGGAALLLPLAASFAQVSVAPAGGEGTSAAAVAGQQSQIKSPAAVGPSAGTMSVQPVPAANGQPRFGAADLDAARGEVQELRDRLAEAEARLALLERGGTGRPAAAGSPGGGRFAPSHQSPEQRLDALERQLTQMLHELRQLKHQMHPDQGQAEGNSASSELGKQ